jgi:hypothetical protein
MTREPTPTGPVGPKPAGPSHPAPSRPTQPTRPRIGLLPVAQLASVLLALDKGRRGPRPPARHPGGRTCRSTLLMLPLLALWVALRALLPSGRSPGRAPRAHGVAAPRESAHPGLPLAVGARAPGGPGGGRRRGSPAASP